ncbi:MAG: hypothetical protein FJZ64_02755 [Chlamydiae bacterium]|nr:hypothetical protein [Chlamydiota bacterium]
MQAENIYSEYQVRLLPPWYQEQQERAAIINDPRLRELIGNEHVLEIQNIEGGYLVLAEHATVQVKVHYLPSDCCGPAKFELEFILEEADASQS